MPALFGTTKPSMVPMSMPLFVKYASLRRVSLKHQYSAVLSQMKGCLCYQHHFQSYKIQKYTSCYYGCTCLLTFFGNTIIMIMIEIQHREGFHGLIASDRPLTSLYKLLFKNLIRQTKINTFALSHTTRFYNKALTFTSFYSKIIGNYVIPY